MKIATAATCLATTCSSLIADTGLADELLKAWHRGNMAGDDAGVQAKVERGFAPDQMRPVHVFDYTQCAEVAGNNFWHGAVESKLRLRQYLASLISTAGLAQVQETDVVTFGDGSGRLDECPGVLERPSRHADSHGCGSAAPATVTRWRLDATGSPMAGEDGRPLTAMAGYQEDFKEAVRRLHGTTPQPALKLFECRSSR